MEKISTNYAYRDAYKNIYWTETARMNELLVGRKVVEVDVDHMRLDNGTIVRVVPNEGCGGCSSGWYDLETLNRVDNIITRVIPVYGESDTHSGYLNYRIYVIADNERINLLSVEGTDGNGYYGTGFELLVKLPEQASPDDPFVNGRRGKGGTGTHDYMSFLY